MAVLNQVGLDEIHPNTTPVGFTLPEHPTSGETLRPRRALIHVLDNPVRWRADGTNPSATSGDVVAADTYIDWTGAGEEHYDAFALIKRVKFVADASAAGAADVICVFFG